jgi:2,3-bisphosphoglycerate-dependent phosphoglycerate mutase
MRPIMLPMPKVRYALLLAALAMAGSALSGATAPPLTALPAPAAPAAPAAVVAAELIPAPPETGTVTIFLVRHAEKSEDDPRDPSLAAAGQQRAQRLAELLAHEKITHLFSTPLKRTQGTLAPLAHARGLEVISILDVDEQIATLLDLPAGSTAVLAGHSNTVPALVAGLGGTVSATVAGRSGPQLKDDSYDRLFVAILTAPAGSLQPRLLRLLELRYGAP